MRVFRLSIAMDVRVLFPSRCVNLMQRPTESPSHLTVSIAMCTFNGAAFLQLQLDSILRQTSPPEELVVCDDRSTDATMVVLERFRERAPFPVQLYSNVTTLKPAQNFAKCISLCSGEVILLCDQDDIWFPDRIAQTRALFERDARAAFAYTDAPLIDSEGRTLNRTLYASLPIRPRDTEQLRKGGDLLPVLRRYSVLCGATMAFRASLKPAILPLPALWMHDEWIGLVGSALGTAARLGVPVTQYRQHAQQQLGTGEWNTATKLRLARERPRSFYENEVQRLTNGIDALRSHPEIGAVLVPLLEARRRYFRGRLQVQGRGLRATPVLLRLLFAGGYRRYGSGLRSAAKDLSVAFAGGGVKQPAAQAGKG